MPTAVTETAPDWSMLAGDVACPLCDYNLRGLSVPRCPECGYAFAWPDLFDPTRRRHPWLFEHHPERNVRSFVRTWLNNLWPPRLWKSLNPAQRSRPVRLVVYWMAATLLGALAFLAVPVAQVVGDVYEQLVRRAAVRAHFSQPNLLPRARQFVQQCGSVDAAVDSSYPPPFNSAFLRRSWRSAEPNPDLPRALATYVAWPWLTFAVLMLFQGSMRRAKVMPAHVLRCALYACDAALIVGLLFVLALPWADPQVWRPLRYWQVPGSRTLVQFAVSLIILAWTTPRLASAYARYLRFDHPFLAVLASQVIVLLLVEMTAGVWGVN